MEESVSKEYCIRECKKRDEEIDKIINALDRISRIMDGEQQDLQKGMRYQVLTMWGDYLTRKKTSMGFLDWLYRAVIGVVVSWIAFKIGMGGA
ncbi:MAG: hypothetical protein EOL91_10650 [Actinobacteria bacterium]|nr:hypothetical protein [Actinomycetota bacterium]